MVDGVGSWFTEMNEREDEVKTLQQSLTLKEKEVLAQAKELEKAKRAESKEQEDKSEWTGADTGFAVFVFVLLMLGSFCAGFKAAERC